MKIYLNPAISARPMLNNKNCNLNDNEPETTSTEPINGKLNVFAYQDINFSGVNKFVKPQVLSEEGKAIINKMLFLDRIVPELSKLSKPVKRELKLLDTPVQTPKGRYVKLDANEFLFSLDKTQKGKSIYNIEHNYKYNDTEERIESMQCVFDKNGQMTHGQLSNKYQVLSFDRKNGNIRRLTLGDRIDRTTATFAPSRNNPSIWVPVSSQSSPSSSRPSIEGFSYSSMFNDVFMQLTGLNTSIRA